MSVLKKPAPVKLFFSLISRKEGLIELVVNKLVEIYGLYDMKTPSIPFDKTNYYEEELGKNLLRQIVFFETLISPENIVEVKVKSVEIEKNYSENDKRMVNIDPGYVALSRVVLSTGKDYTHRIYLSKGVYGDLTYIYKRGQGFSSLPWTYPDYASNEIKSFFEKARNILKEQIKREKEI